MPLATRPTNITREDPVHYGILNGIACEPGRPFGALWHGPDGSADLTMIAGSDEQETNFRFTDRWQLVTCPECLATRRASLSFGALRGANVARCEQSCHPVHDWSLTDWLTAAAGELGELASEIKNLRRKETEGSSQHAIPETSKRAIADEAADVVIYIDLLCERAGINLGEGVRRKFNEVSDRVGSHIKL